MNIVYLTAIEGFLVFCALVAIIVFFLVRDHKKTRKKEKNFNAKL